MNTGAAVILRAYAKINLTLDVFSRRADAYHGIASIMQTISLHDTLEAQLTDGPGIELTCDAAREPTVLANESNLAWRAAAAALDAHGSSAPGVRLHLVKRIPAQAGLGGGSSDAAAALRAVSLLLDNSIAPDELHGIALQLGSDVPFFLLGGCASARGRGENLLPLPDLPAFWIVIVKPDESVATAWAYCQLDAVPNRRSHRATGRMERAVLDGDIERVLAGQCNDFELVVFDRIPGLAWIHDEIMMAGATSAHLCGSGSAVYGVAPSEQAADRIASLLRTRYPCVEVASTVGRCMAAGLD